MSDKINDYHDLAGLVDDDIVIVCLLVQIKNMKVNSNLMKDIEMTRFKNIDFTDLLELNHKTIKDLTNLLRPKSLDYRNKNIVKTITRETNLLDFMESEY